MKLDLPSIIALVDRAAVVVQSLHGVLPEPASKVAEIVHNMAQLTPQIIAIGEQAKETFAGHPSIGELENSLASLQSANDAAFARVDAALSARARGS